MNIKQKIDNPRIWQLLTTVLTAVLSYFGYTQMGNNTPAPQDVDVEVVVPTQNHSHKNWDKDISNAVNKGIADHVDKSH